MLKSKVVLAIDPGPEKSAFVAWDGKTVVEHGIETNDDLIAIIKGLNTALKNSGAAVGSATLVVEQIKSYGMAVSDSIFDTVFWSGRFAQAWKGNWVRIPRMDVKIHLCHDSRAKDTNIRQALIDRFGVPGTKKDPGMLYGIKADEWAALAVGVTFYDLYIEEVKA